MKIGTKITVMSVSHILVVTINTTVPIMVITPDTTEVSEFSAVRENLESAGYSFLSAELTMIPQNTNEITDPDTLAKIQKMLEMLDDLDDVQDVYHNGELPEDEEEDD